MRPYAGRLFARVSSRRRGASHGRCETVRRCVRAERRVARREGREEIRRNLANARLYGLVEWDGLDEAHYEHIRGWRVRGAIRMTRRMMLRTFREMQRANNQRVLTFKTIVIHSTTITTITGSVEF